MAGSGRYCFTPMVMKKIGRRVTLGDRIRAWKHRRNQQTPDVFMVTGYSKPVLPAGFRGRLE